jgi:hypothetical protein
MRHRGEDTAGRNRNFRRDRLAGFTGRARYAVAMNPQANDGTERIERRTLATLASDVVGHPRAMEPNEAGTIGRVTRWQG